MSKLYTFNLKLSYFSLLLFILVFLPFKAKSNAITEVNSVLTVPVLQAHPSLIGAISLKWSTVEGASGYVLEKSRTGISDTFIPLQTFGPSITEYRHTGLAYNEKLFYRIKAIGTGSVESAFSAPVSATTHPQSYVVKIMPLGDSNTEGGSSTVVIEDKAAYRDKLEGLLNGTNIKGKYDFIGSQKSGSKYMTDTDHAGFGGATTGNILSLLQNGFYYTWDPATGQNTKKVNGSDGPYLETFSPDIVLLHIGTNNVNSTDAIKKLESVLNEIDGYEKKEGKEVIVVLAKIIKRVCNDKSCPHPAEAEATIAYNNNLEALANKRIAEGDELILVDMQDGANINYNYSNQGGDMADPLHPSKSGYDKMAQVWFKTLQPLLDVLPKPADYQAPDAVITSKPDEVTNQKEADFTFSSNEANSYFQIKLNGGQYLFVTSPYRTPSLADGKHSISVRAIDQAGNVDDSPAVYTWTIDTEAPKAPIIITPENGKVLANSKPEYKGTSEAGTNVTLYFDNKEMGKIMADAGGNWALQSSASLADGQYTITATATDAAGNKSPISGANKFIIDTKAPETFISSAPVPFSASPIAEFSFSSNESNVIYYASLNGNPFDEISNPYKLSNLADGEYTLKVFSKDQAGNQDPTPATHSWVVDTKAPDAPIIISLSEDRGIEVDDHITSDNTIIIKGKAEPLSLVEVLHNKSKAGEAKASDTGEWQLSFENKILADGEHVFIATAKDASGNKSTKSISFKVHIDTKVPEGTLFTESSGNINQPFKLEINFSEEVYTLKPEHLGVTNGSVNQLTKLSPTSYSVEVIPIIDGEVVITLPSGKVIDKAGNLNKASNTIKLVYDSKAPAGYALNFNVPIINFTTKDNVKLQVTGAEIGASYSYTIKSATGNKELTGEGIVQQPSFFIGPLAISELNDGTVTAVIQLTDEAGNIGQAVSKSITKLIKDIVSVEKLTQIKVPFRTTFEQLELPIQVEVSYSNGEKESLKVTWGKGNYDGFKPTIYTLQGELELKPNAANSQNMLASVQIEVEPNKAPTSLTFSASTFKPDIQPNEYIGIFSTTDPDDDQFTYELVSGASDVHNDFFKIVDDKLYLISNQGLSGISNFKIRVKSTDPYQNSIEQNFSLQKSLFKGFEKIDLVNAFSPDGDGINDTWLIPELRFFNNVVVEVYDRSGTLLYQSSNPEEGWNGTGKDGQVRKGSYFYIIQVKDIELVQKGVVTVLK